MKRKLCPKCKMEFTPLYKTNSYCKPCTAKYVRERTKKQRDYFKNRKNYYDFEMVEKLLNEDIPLAIKELQEILEELK